MFTYNVHHLLLPLFSFTVSNYLQNFKKILGADKENKAYKLSDPNLCKNTTLLRQIFFQNIHQSLLFTHSVSLPYKVSRKALEWIIRAKHTSSECGKDDPFFGVLGLFPSYILSLLLFTYNLLSQSKNFKKFLILGFSA